MANTVSVWRNQPSDLMTVAELKTDRVQEVPLFLEFHINPDTAPFLVTSTRSFLWITPRRDMIRAGTRFLNMPHFFMDVVDEVAQTGIASLWGNVQPLTQEGLEQGIAYLHDYQYQDLELLVSPDDDIPWDTTLPIHTAPWMRKGTAVILPTDREYVGLAMMVNNGVGLGILHNPSRALAILR